MVIKLLTNNKADESAGLNKLLCGYDCHFEVLLILDVPEMGRFLSLLLH